MRKKQFPQLIPMKSARSSLTRCILYVVLVLGTGMTKLQAQESVNSTGGNGK